MTSPVEIDLEDEILQDFLMEAGEILELLGEQLVDLEQSPDDNNLLNAVFRGFHTIKGGAGFLQLEPMVEICHVCEDVFNILRNGERSITPELMDAILQGLDTVNTQFSNIHEAIYPEPVDANLIATVKDFAMPEGEAPEPAATVELVAVATPEATQSETSAGTSAETPADDGDITDEEFEALLDSMVDDKKTTATSESATPSVEKKISASPGTEDISDDEFENLLDELHGKGKHSGGLPAANDNVPSSQPDKKPDDDLISDDEFESLLDDIHGKGKGPVADTGQPAGDKPSSDKPAVRPESTSVPEQKPEPAPAPKKPAAKAAPKKTAPTETTVRVDTERLDDIMNLVGELVLVRNRLSNLRETMGESSITHAIGNLDQVTSNLQSSVMKTRMQPVKKVFGRFPRVVRDLSRQINKEINLEMVGEETDLDKNLVEALADPLVHLVRNAVDHGIELPDVRVANGKERAGTVVLSAQQEGDHILLAISDDGAGMDPEVLRTKVVEKGLMDEDVAARLTEKECYGLIFMAGFSTKDEISDISGRGVGMDVVKTRIAQLNGALDIDSELGKGTTLTIKVPLTLAILPTLMIQIGARIFALPLSNVNEIFELETRRTNIVDSQLVVNVRDTSIPVFYLYKWMLLPGEEPVYPEGQGQVIIVQVGSRMVGLVVDLVLGQEEVVIKPLGSMLHGLPGFAGSTITGDGSIALIIDVQSLLKARAAKAVF